MADPNHADLVDQIRTSEHETEALANRIANADESTTEPAEFAAMRAEQEHHRKHILQCKSEIDQRKWLDGSLTLTVA
ncbi:hypothetical protein HDF08_003623 [Edaphobacter lichenicola]|uniref:Uncharacterized protein n=1 Tax=Tunturiibacter lichenicola TaxID=2051959 RepID=A0A852VK36_9BACT|nr:hypothetical protein [Edaphobacter lichenicola]